MSCPRHPASPGRARLIGVVYAGDQRPTTLKEEGSLREPVSPRPRRRPDVVLSRSRGPFAGVESCVSENAHFYKAGPDRSRALLNSRV